MSRTGCQIRGWHEWRVETDRDGWPVGISCDDWECAEYIEIPSESSTPEESRGEG